VIKQETLKITSELLEHPLETKEVYKKIKSSTLK
jgi:hypothetical protein